VLINTAHKIFKDTEIKLVYDYGTLKLTCMTNITIYAKTENLNQLRLGKNFLTDKPRELVTETTNVMRKERNKNIL
jgi:hypothetical protein